MTEFGKVAVLLGGPSAEREVSLMSGNGVLAALREKGVDAHPFDPAERDLFDLKREGFARAFIALHGRFGEDGTVQGALETLGIPYTGSGVMASALATDKWRTKLIWLASDVPTPKYRVVDARTDWMRVVAELGLPLIVKPAREGSTIGITKVAKVDHDELALAYAEAAKHDSLVLVEEFVTGAELTASIVNGRALPLIRIEAPQGNYDYQNKYFTDDTKYICPCGLPAAEERRIQDLVMRAADVLGCSGWGRADLIRRADGTVSLLEINTSPGMTGHSLVPMAAKVAGISFDQLVVRILELAHVG
jgi:D-alanine-D-alanine ligase